MDRYINKKLDGRYLLTELLGVGGMAYVYKATDLKDGSTVAVKILKEELLENAELVRRFKNESRAIGLLDHENIVKVLDVNYSDSVQYIVMELLSGLTLKEYIDAAKPVAWKNAVFITEQLLKALQHAHDRGIIHRDIKPQNVMISEDGKVKVMDFGIARFSRSRVHTVTDKAIGTVHYISPEQARGDDTDARSDLYSVGVMMYEMCTGRLPFDGDSAVAVALMQISDEAPLPRSVNPEIPEGLEEIIVRATEKDPDRRYQSAGAMLLDLQEFRKNPNVSFDYRYIPQSAGTAAAAAAAVHQVSASAVSAPTVAVEVPKTPVPAPEKRLTFSAPKEEPKEKVMAKKETNITKPARKSGSKKKKAPRAKTVNLPLALLMGFSAVFLIGAIILAVMTLQNSGSQIFTNHEDRDLPDFAGMELAKVQTDASYALFNFKVVEDYNSEYPAGVIYDQTPVAPKVVKDNANITLYVSKGPKIVAVPDVIGKTYGEAMKLLQEQGLVVLRETSSVGDMEGNTITNVDPAVGTSLEAGSTVTIYVNSPATLVTTRVPQLIGLDFTTAKATLSVYGLLLGEVTEVFDSSTAPGTVLEQSIPEGMVVSNGVVIDLVITSNIGEFTRSFNIAMPYMDRNGNTTFTVNFFSLENNRVATVVNAHKIGGAVITRTGGVDEQLKVELNGILYQLICLNYQEGTYTVIEDYSSANGFSNNAPAFSISVNCSEGGTASFPATVTEGGNCLIRISPKKGYRILSVTDNGVDVTSRLNGNNYNINKVDCDHQIVIKFESSTPTPPGPGGDTGSLFSRS